MTCKYSDCSGLTSIIIPRSVTSIGYWAFRGCSSLASITVKAENTTYDSRNNCNAIIETATNTLIAGCQNTVISNSVTSIGDEAFYYCSGLTSITIPNSVTNIGRQPFEYCSGLTSIIVETGNTTYDSRNNCNAIIETASNTRIVGCQNTVIPNSVTNIGNSAFLGCRGLTSITIPGCVTSIGNYAFAFCSGLTSVTIPNSVTQMGFGAFSYCSGLTSVTIPNSMTSISQFAFFSCSGLTSVTIGSGVRYIGYTTFSHCSSLTDVYCYAENVPNTDSDAFKNSPVGSATLHVPEGSLQEYKTSSPWRGFGTIVGLTQDMIDGIREIKNESFTPTLSNGEGDCYDLNGRMLAAPQKGINIIRYSDGSTRKVMVK